MLNRKKIARSHDLGAHGTAKGGKRAEPFIKWGTASDEQKTSVVFASRWSQLTCDDVDVDDDDMLCA